MRALFLCLAVAAAGCQSDKPRAVAPAPEGSPARILQFYAAPGIISRGESANLCYGTENVTKVRIEPPVESLAPALSRCFAVSPTSTTTYILIAEGGGEAREKSAEVVVDRAAARAPAAGDPLRPKVVEFIARRNDVEPGTDVMFCYSVINTTRTSLYPGVADLKDSKQGCFTVKAEETKDYTLVAVGAMGIIDRKSVTLRVK